MNSIKIPYLIYPVILGLIVGWFTSSVIGNAFARPKPLPAVSVRKTDKPTAVPRLTENIIRDNIFALALSPAPVNNSASTGNNPEVAGADVPPPPPPFTAKLLGILKYARGENGIALISTDEGTVSIKLGGEKNGLKLVSLDDFSAVVEKEGKKYTLTLEKGDTNPQGTRTATKEAAPPQQQQTGANINIGLKRDEVRSELKDLNKILQSALVSPFYQNGEFLGYRVTRMREDSPLRKLGLMPGDTITRINGSELKSPEPLFSMLSQIDDISAITMDMIRNTEKKTIFVEIQ